MDLIAGLPGDDEAGLLDSVRQVLALEPDNLTIHCLARKRGAPLRFGKQGTLPAEAMDRCHDAVFAAGYRPYYLYRQKYMAGGLENVGFCKPGTENRYNVVMMEELAPVAALGCGGIGKVLRGENAIKRYANPKYPIEYIQRRESILAEKTEQFAAMAEACRD
jgi:oxygen-independent coproporphyrinogen-3 oxidase